MRFTSPTFTAIAALVLCLGVSAIPMKDMAEKREALDLETRDVITMRSEHAYATRDFDDGDVLELRSLDEELDAREEDELARRSFFDSDDVEDISSRDFDGFERMNELSIRDPGDVLLEERYVQAVVSAVKMAIEVFMNLAKGIKQDKIVSLGRPFHSTHY